MISKDITVVGSIALDSLETPRGARSLILGGSAMYFSLSASLFSSVEVIGVVGTDFPKEGWEIFKSHNINYNNINIKNGKTFSWGGRYNNDYSKRETLFTNLGVFEDYQPTIKNSTNKSGTLFLANIHPSLQLDVLNQMRSYVSLVVADTMNLWIDTDPDGVSEVISNSDIFLLNDEEAMQLTGLSNLHDAGEQILRQGPDTVIIKMGARGSLLMDKDYIFNMPCVPNIDVLDPTGAGDSFAGGLVGFISQFGLQDKKNALAYASAIASFIISDFGINQLLHLNLDDVKSRVDVIKKLIEQ